MYDKIEDIKRAVNSFVNNTTHLRIRTRWKGDFDLYRLAPYSAGSGYYSYTTNSPRVFADKVISMLNAAKLQVRVPAEILPEPDRRIANNVERLIYGMIQEAEEQAFKKGMPTIREQMSWYAAIRGSFMLRAYLTEEKGVAVPNIAVWDIYNAAYGLGKNGLLWAAYTRRAPAEEVSDEYGIDAGKTGTEIDVIDYWDTEKFAVIANNRWAQKPAKHGCIENGVKYCPVYLVKNGAMPAIHQDYQQDLGRFEGESIYASTRELYSTFNKTMSDHLNIVRRGVKPPMGYWSAGGAKTLDEDIFQVEKAGVVQLDSLSQEKIEPIIQPTMPKDSGVLVETVSGEIQRGNFPHTSYGELGFRLSGFAINQLQSSIESVIHSPLASVERGLDVLAMTILSQFSKMMGAEANVRGRTSRNEAFGYTKAVKLTPADVKGNWRPETRLTPVLPKDDAQKMYLANLARQGDIPLLSYRTIRDQILELPDPELEEELIQQEWAKNLPILKLYAAFLSAINDKRPDIAENILSELQRVLGEQMPAPPGGRTSNPSDMEQLAAENQAGLQAPEGTGLPSSVLPAEMLDGMPAGARNAGKGA